MYAHCRQCDARGLSALASKLICLNLQGEVQPYQGAGSARDAAPGRILAGGHPGGAAMRPSPDWRMFPHEPPGAYFVTATVPFISAACPGNEQKNA